ncbi:MAG: hypothetical protein IPP17_17595 [Bacteroidetes bacterium]|nr:hypothetical protein [Bacteroidota bacterium]
MTRTMITGAMTPPPSIRPSSGVARSAEVWPSQPEGDGFEYLRSVVGFACAAVAVAFEQVQYLSLSWS